MVQCCYKFYVKSLNSKQKARKPLLSIYVRDLLDLNVSLPAIQGSLNSKPNVKKENDSNNEKLTFKIVKDELNTETTMQLEKISNIADIDLVKWSKKLRTINKLLKWKKTAAKDVFELLLDTEIFETIGEITSLEDGLKRLIELKYPITTIRILKKELNFLKQKDFIWIKDYYNAIKEKIEIINIIEKRPKSEVEVLTNQTFLNGLHHKSEKKLTELGLFDTEEIVERISLVERGIVARQNTNIQPKHKTLNHNDKPSDKTFSKNYKHNYNNKNVKNITTEENKKELKFKSSIDGKETLSLIDTGATENFINYNIAEKLKIKTVSIKPVEVIFGNKEKAKITKRAEFVLSIDTFPNKSFCTTALVANISEDIILGTKWMIDNRCIIDFNENCLTLDSQQAEMPVRNTTTNKITNVKNLELSKLIDKYNKAIDMKESAKVEKFQITIKNEDFINGKQYNVPLCLIDKTNDHLKELISEKIIEPSASYHNSPAFPKVKPDGTIRLLIDYKMLNKVTKTEPHPYPEIHKSLYDLYGSNIFSKIDLKRGYYQIEMNPNSKDLTSFSILNQKYKFNRLPFGLKNAPFFFQKTISQIIGHLPYIKIFIDDILVFSKNRNDHLNQLQEIFTILAKYNIIINFKKCIFLSNEVSYLGQIINKDGMYPDTSRVNKLVIKAPKSKRELMKIIGIIQWYRPYVKHLSSRMAPLTNFLRTKETLKTWNEKDTAIINEIIEEIKKEILLNHPNPNTGFELATDASNIGTGATLSQNNKIIGLYSYKFKESQLNYTIVEKEFFSIIKALKHFEHILKGSKITVLTDNKNLLNYDKIELNRIKNWKWLLLEYNVKIKHIPAEKNVLPDNISRLATVNKTKNYCLKEAKSIVEIHELAGHPGFLKTHELCETILKTKTNKDKIKNLVNKCLICQTIKPFKSNYCKLHSSIVYKNPGECIAVDIAGPYIIDQDKYYKQIYLLVIVDAFCRYTEIFPIIDLKSETTLDCIKEYFRNRGFSKRIMCDLGRQFTSEIFQTYCKEKNINIKFSSANTPTNNSLVERTIKTINEIMIYMKQNKKISTIKETIENRLNLTIHSTLKERPYELFFLKNYFTNEKINNAIKLYSNVLNRIKEAGKINQEKSNKKRIKHEFKIDDYIFIKNKKLRKQDLVWLGPFSILETTKNKVKVDKISTLQWISKRNIRPAVGWAVCAKHTE